MDTAASQYQSSIDRLRSLSQRRIQNSKEATQENILEAQRKAQDKFKEALAGNLIKDSEMREKHEALANLGLQAAMAPDAFRSLRDTIQKAGQTLKSDKNVMDTPKQIANIERNEGNEQAGRVGQDFERDPETINPSSEGVEMMNTGAAPDINSSLANSVATENAEEVGTAGAEAAESLAADTAIGLGMEALAPISVLAGIGFAGFEAGKVLFGHHKSKPQPPPPPKNFAPSNQTIVPTHRTASVAPSRNSQLMNAGATALTA